MTPRDLALWNAARPWLDVRSNDVHTLIAWRLAGTLLTLRPGADPKAATARLKALISDPSLRIRSYAEAAQDDLLELLAVVGDAAAGAAHGEAGPDDGGQANEVQRLAQGAGILLAEHGEFLATHPADDGAGRRIAGEPHFYGLLAAEELDQPHRLPPQASAPSVDEIRRAEATPAIARALKLFELDPRTVAPGEIQALASGVARAVAFTRRPCAGRRPAETPAPDRRPGRTGCKAPESAECRRSGSRLFAHVLSSHQSGR